MFEEYNENTNFFGFTFEDIRGICERHIAEGNPPYDEEEFMKIMTWIEEVMIDYLLLMMMMAGKVDVVFDYEKFEKEGMNPDTGLLFTLTQYGKDLAQKMKDTNSPEVSILNRIKFKESE